MKSGSDSPQETDPVVSSLGQLSGESLPSNIKPEVKNSLAHLDLRSGDLKSIKKAANQHLVKAAENSGFELTEGGKETITRFVDQVTRGFASSMNMICSTKCPFLSACPIKASGSPIPVGQRCPVEDTIIAIWVTKHLRSLGIDDLDDPSHSFDMDMLYELAGQELIRWRCGVHLSDDPSLVENKLVGYSVNGDAIFADVINPVLDVMERAGRNIAKIREALVATRKTQMEIGQTMADPTQKAADLRERAKKIAAARKLTMQEVIKDADYKVKDE